ncbi:MAG TPA: zinc-ribbon domain-containing protein [Candidatus Eisenbacteria bacterium]
MTVRCPHCSTRYELPERLMGPAGAQVRCPSCRGVFGVAPDGTVREGAKPPAAAPARAPEGARPSPSSPESPPAPGMTRVPGAASAAATSPPTPETVAVSLVGELAARAGEGPREAFARGRLFSERGPALTDLYGEYRRRVGAAASGAPLRAALRARWGIELPEGDPPGFAR